ncbi:inactive TPR repeat-containing thioredoxin TTL3-like [Nymphaea colorata]|nr:inactive TPR repeat-containing thioredoxin TTL3-like [Nymphaea colorata]
MNVTETRTSPAFERAEKSRHGCSIFSKVFGKRRFWRKRDSLAGSSIGARGRGSGNGGSRRRKMGSDEASFLTQGGGAMSPSSQSNAIVQVKRAANEQACHGCSTLVRASSKVMVLGHLGNIRQATTPTYSAPDKHRYVATSTNKDQRAQTPPKANPVAYAAAAAAAEAVSSDLQKKYGYGNIVATRNTNKNNNSSNDHEDPKTTADGTGKGGAMLSKALSKRLNPEELKEAGNEEYKNGRFAQALAYYDQAIFLDPNRASYHSNKSAALTGLGRLLDAVSECKEAIRLEPTYARAHLRLATLYFRLGIMDKSLSHHAQAGAESKEAEKHQAQAVQARLARCTDARKLRDYHTLLTEAASAISAGADAAPYLFASEAEALMRLQRHEEADNVLSSGPQFEVEATTKLFGAASNAYFLLVRAQVDMASGRFETAVSVAQHAANLDPSNKEVGSVLERARAVAAARSDGNELFKASKFGEACAAYSEGLEHEPMNATLLCNRAACKYKLGQWEKAIEDCNASLKLRPNYCKARLRRADCSAKLGRWEVAIQDYEALLQRMPDDAEMLQKLANARLQLKRQLEGKDLRDDSAQDMDLPSITSMDLFKQFVRSPDMCVVLFCTKSSEPCNQIMPFAVQLSKKYPSIHFLKVDIEESPSLAMTECVGSLPVFKIYKHGNKVKDIIGNNQTLLESTVKYFSTR